MPKSKKGSRAGVSVYTWGSEMPLPGESGFDGMKHFYETMAFGGNVGHAAMKLTLPDTQENRALVQKYIASDTYIPYVQRKYTTPGVSYTRPTRQNPNPKKRITNEPAYEEEVIEVYFSWWPSQGGGGFFVSEKQDGIGEREGVNVNYATQWEAVLAPEIRKKNMPLTGRLISALPFSSPTPKVVKFGISSVLHPVGMIESCKELVEAKHQIDILEGKWDGLSLLKARLSLNRPITLTEELLLKRFFSSEELDELGFKNRLISSEKLPMLLEKVDSKLMALEHEKAGLLLLSLKSIFDNVEEADLMSLPNSDKAKALVDALSLKENIEKQETFYSEILALANDEENNFFAGFFNYYSYLFSDSITTGTPPEHVVELPIQTDRVPGLNVEAMLKKMHDIAVGERGFNLVDYNCSFTTTDVLKAGAGEQSWVFDQKAFSGAICTPQTVFNNASQYSRVIQNPNYLYHTEERSYLKKMEEALAKTTIRQAGIGGIQPPSIKTIIPGLARFGLMMLNGTINSLTSAASEGLNSVSRSLMVGYSDGQQMVFPESAEHYGFDEERKKKVEPQTIINPLQLNDAEFAELSRNPGMFPGASMLLSGQLRKGEKLARKVPEFSDDGDPDHSPKKQRTKKK